ncbi:MAG TPA: CDGSH iron-sulfur domain-containing protein [Candidatus Deferrimicrobium sp.]|nr:CDGSH iron-sulfur domain-containing protein [Candidatus Deferrimicrobium sp.]
MSDNNRNKKPSIVFTRTTPYMVTGLENFCNSRREKIVTKRVMILCRCGLAKNKPYCDNSHIAKGIDGEKQPDRVKDRVVDYRGKDITIHDNRGVCSVDQACVNLLPTVFKRNAKRWIDPDGASVGEIIDVIEKCPSGALSYTVGHIKCTDQDRPPGIKVAKNGPLEITGGITLEDDMDSKPQSGEHYTLCRCGNSKNKPFCDGAHIKTKFIDDVN